MDFCIFSDSHGNRDAILRALSRQVRKPDAILFLGDGIRDLSDREDDVPVWRVRGNCDWYVREEIPTETVLRSEGHALFLTHGHAYNVKSGLDSLALAGIRAQCDLILFGHTHEPYRETIPSGTRIGETVMERPVTLFNPGSVGYGGSFGTLHLLESAVLFGHGTR